MLIVACKRVTAVRGVAQPGSVLAWGARGRVFESHRPDQITVLRSPSKSTKPSIYSVLGFFYVYSGLFSSIDIR